jgi:hypothetical protein
MFVFTLSRGLYYTILSFQMDLSGNLSICKLYSWTVSQNFRHTKLSWFTLYRGSQFIWLRKPEYPEHGTVLIVLNYNYSCTWKIKQPHKEAIYWFWWPPTEAFFSKIQPPIEFFFWIKRILQNQKKLTKYS